MLELLNTIRANAAETPDKTPDTGTFADGVLSFPAVDVRAASRQDNGRSAYARDYGTQRKVQRAIIGYA
ncbi:hypothetical protein [Rhizobium arsenicireducens]